MPHAASQSLVLTGATSGLGLALARRLADSGSYQPILLCRNERRRDELSSLLGDRDVHYAVCDLSSLASVRAAAAGLGESVRSGALAPIGAVVLNAAMHPGRRVQVTAEGMDSTMVTNLVAPHLLLALLSPYLGAEARLVLVGSGAHQRQRWWTGLPGPADLPLDQVCRPGVLRGPQAYVTSKRGTVQLCQAYSERAPQGYAVLSYDPGIMPATEITREMNTLSRWLFRTIMTRFADVEGFSTPEHSASWLYEFLTQAPASAGLSYAKIDGYQPWPSGAGTADGARALFDAADEIAGVTTDSVARWWLSGPPA